MPSRQAQTFLNPLWRREDGVTLITGVLTVLAAATLGWFVWQVIEEPLWAILVGWAIVSVVPFLLQIFVDWAFFENGPERGYD